jgi:hypothetical protein
MFFEINQEQEINHNEENKINLDLQSKKFWECFSDALNSNIRGSDGYQRMLSIIAESFTYSQLCNNLKVRF